MFCVPLSDYSVPPWRWCVDPAGSCNVPDSSEAGGGSFGKEANEAWQGAGASPASAVMLSAAAAVEGLTAAVCPPDHPLPVFCNRSASSKVAKPSHSSETAGELARSGMALVGKPCPVISERISLAIQLPRRSALGWHDRCRRRHHFTKPPSSPTARSRAHFHQGPAGADTMSGGPDGAGVLGNLASCTPCKCCAGFCCRPWHGPPLPCFGTAHAYWSSAAPLHRLVLNGESQLQQLVHVDRYA